MAHISNSILSKLNYFSFRPFDESTQEGQRSERNRRAVLSAIASVFAKVCNVLVTLYSIKIALPVLNVPTYGVWMTISSVTSVLMILDFGIGNSMVSRVATLDGQKRLQELKVLISSGLLILASIAILMWLILGLASLFLPISWLFKDVSGADLDAARSALFAFITVFCLSMPMQTAGRIFVGFQRGYLNDTFQCLFSLTSLVLLTLCTTYRAPLYLYVLSTFGVQSLAGLALLILLFKRGYLVRLKKCHIFSSENSHLLKSGGQFFILQLGMLIGWTSDSLIVSSQLGPVAVATFAVTQRIFSIFLTTPLAMVNMPLWATYANAIALHDWTYVRATLRKSLMLNLLIGVLASIFLLFSFTFLMRQLTSNLITVPVIFLVLYALWSTLLAVSQAFNMYLNGSGRLKSQITVAIIFSALVLPSKLMLVGRFGLESLPLLGSLTFVIANIITYGFLYRQDVYFLSSNSSTHH